MWERGNSDQKRGAPSSAVVRLAHVQRLMEEEEVAWRSRSHWRSVYMVVVPAKWLGGTDRQIKDLERLEGMQMNGSLALWNELGDG